MPPLTPRENTDALSAARSTELTEVRGWASDNFVIDDQPAVVVNLNADALTMLSWGFGQLQQVSVALNDLSAAGYSHDPSHKTLGCLLHFLMQAETVLRTGIEKVQKSSFITTSSSRSDDQGNRK